MTITHQTVVDSEGKPAAELIPWSEFLLIQEILEGGEITAEEEATLREAEADRQSGNRDSFVDLTSLKAELALWDASDRPAPPRCQIAALHAARPPIADRSST